MCAAAALAVIRTLGRERLLERATELGGRWAAQITALPGVAGVRGAGLLLGVVLDPGVGPAAEVAADLLERGFIVNAPRPDTLRLAPPLILSDDDAHALTTALGEVLAARLNREEQP